MRKKVHCAQVAISPKVASWIWYLFCATDKLISHDYGDWVHICVECIWCAKKAATLMRKRCCLCVFKITLEACYHYTVAVKLLKPKFWKLLQEMHLVSSAKVKPGNFHCCRRFVVAEQFQPCSFPNWKCTHNGRQVFTGMTSWEACFYS